MAAEVFPEVGFLWWCCRKEWRWVRKGEDCLSWRKPVGVGSSSGGVGGGGGG